jgi:hypothetical protein
MAQSPGGRPLQSFFSSIMIEGRADYSKGERQRDEKKRDVGEK